MSKQIVGWALLILGVILIIWGVWDSYKIFTGQKLAPQIFPYSLAVQEVNKAINVISPDTKNVKPEQVQQQQQQQMQELLQNQIGKMLPPDLLPKAMNLFSWSLFVAILVMAAGKIAMLGIGLLKAG